MPPTPPLQNFSLDALNSEQKPAVKNRSTRLVRNRSTGRSTGVDFEIYRSGRVEKTLTGFISDPENMPLPYTQWNELTALPQMHYKSILGH